jgi:succinate dehydrogenase/fumarate reductase cytochrome b subunit
MLTTGLSVKSLHGIPHILIPFPFLLLSIFYVSLSLARTMKDVDQFAKWVGVLLLPLGAVEPPPGWYASQLHGASLSPNISCSSC